MQKRYKHCESVPEIKNLSFMKSEYYPGGDGKCETYKYLNKSLSCEFLIWSSNLDEGYSERDFSGLSSIIIYTYLPMEERKRNYTCFGHFFSRLKKNEQEEILSKAEAFVALGLI